MKELALKKSLLSCPGDTIQEHINTIGMSQVELAERLGRSIPKLNELIKGKNPITSETATKLEYVLGISASFWLNLERQYQEELLKINQMEKLKHYKEWISNFPLLDMKKLGIIPDTQDKIVIAESILKYFRVASPVQWSDLYTGTSFTFQIEKQQTTETKAIAVWLRLGEIQAEQIDVSSYNKKSLRNLLDKFKEIAYTQPNNWLAKLQNYCATCGVALVYTPCISKAPIYGATRWIRNKSIPLIQITDKQKDYNAFWFTFFHEIAHILYHGKKEIFIEWVDNIIPNMEKEKEADQFASRMLLTEIERKELFQYDNFDQNLVLKLSKKFKKHTDIIVAQIQKKYNHLYKNVHLNRLKTKVIFDPIKL